jgi:hypothetical protein
MTEQALRNDELEDSVPQKLETLIIKMIALCFVTHARMGQGLGQQERIAKLIPNAFLERRHVNVSDKLPMTL